MIANPRGYDLPARAANAFNDAPDKERGSILSTARRHLAFLDDPRIVAALSRSDFSPDDLKARKITAPCWIVVTSQEKLDEVVAAIDSKRVELAKLQDRFRYRVDLAPSDIREVATKRVLAKKTAAEKPLKDLFKKNEGQLNAALRLERTTRRTDIN